MKKRATHTSKSLRGTLATILAVVLLASVLAVSPLAISAKAATLEPADTAVEFISVMNDGTFCPLCAKYATQNIDLNGNFSAPLMPIDGCVPVKCIGWSQKGRVTAEIVEGYNDNFIVKGQLIDIAGSHDPARVLVLYERDERSLSFVTQYYAADETEPGMGSIQWQKKSEDGSATFEVPVSDKLLLEVVGSMAGVEVQPVVTDGTFSGITVKTTCDIVVSVYNRLDGCTDYVFTSAETTDSVTVSTQRRTVFVSTRHFIADEEGGFSETGEYGDVVAATIGDDGFTTIYQPVEGDYVVLGSTEAADVAAIKVVLDEETDRVDHLEFTINRNVVIDIYHDAVAGTIRYVVYVDENYDLGISNIVLQGKTPELPDGSDYSGEFAEPD